MVLADGAPIPVNPVMNALGPMYGSLGILALVTVVLVWAFMGGFRLLKAWYYAVTVGASSKARVNVSEWNIERQKQAEAFFNRKSRTRSEIPPRDDLGRSYDVEPSVAPLSLVVPE